MNIHINGLLFKLNHLSLKCTLFHAFVHVIHVSVHARFSHLHSYLKFKMTALPIYELRHSFKSNEIKTNGLENSEYKYKPKIVLLAKCGVQLNN